MIEGRGSLIVDPCRLGISELPTRDWPTLLLPNCLNWRISIGRIKGQLRRNCQPSSSPLYEPRGRAMSASVGKLCLLLLVILAFVNNGLAVSLDGAWTVTVEKLGRPFPAIVPGGIYTDLWNAGVIPENLRERNDVVNRWVGNRTVRYWKQFEVDSELLEAPKIFLVFHGLDTFATIYVNQRQVGRTSNMFVRYEFDVKEHLKIGTNGLTVTFEPPIKKAQEMYDRQAANYTVPPKCVPDNYNGECHVNHIRKMQASFGWDWGPAFPSVGIWKSVELLVVKDAHMFDFSVDVMSKKGTWEVAAKVLFLVGSSDQLKPVRGSLEVVLKAGNDSNFRASREVALDPKKTHVTETMTLKINESQVELWWPNGYGNQKLYDLEVNFKSSSSSFKRTKRVGFRTVELRQAVVGPSKGYTFSFQVNGVPVFAKGSNWIPASVFPELSSEPKVVRNLLESSREAHMNMLRVWGGGIYESELFYELADELGIMIWQDFMFACSMYPTDRDFLDSVRVEVRQNVERLKSHACVVLWAGNNENEAALYGDWYGTGKDSIYREDYIKLYVDVVKREVEELDVTRAFVVSSPSDGAWTDANGFLGPDPYSKLYGDVHHYNYLVNGWDVNNYPIPRFSSEYGFQSIPSIEELSSATKNTMNLAIDSVFMKHRQHLPAGWFYMKILIEKNFLVPKSNDSLRDFSDYVYLSQINQAVSMKVQTESYRQTRDTVNSLGEGLTMGALYWQLNDVWQAPSWSSIEFSGRWKMLHYFAVEFFAPVIASPRLASSNQLELFVLSDELAPITNASFTLNVYKWDSPLPVYTKNYSIVELPAWSSRRIDSLWLDMLLKKASCGGTFEEAKKNCLVELTLENEQGELIAPANYVYPAPPKHVVLPFARVTAEVDPTLLPGKHANYWDYRVQVLSDKIALFVWLETPGIEGRFSENGFHIVGRNKSVVFHAREALTPEALSKSLRIRTLSQLYDPNR